jgi:hypothetical protein
MKSEVPREDLGDLREFLQSFQRMRSSPASSSSSQGRRPATLFDDPEAAPSRDAGPNAAGADEGKEEPTEDQRRELEAMEEIMKRVENPTPEQELHEDDAVVLLLRSMSHLVKFNSTFKYTGLGKQAKEMEGEAAEVELMPEWIAYDESLASERQRIHDKYDISPYFWTFIKALDGYQSLAP